MRDHAGRDLGVGGAVEVVVVEVEDGVGVRRAGGLEGDGDEVFAQDLGEDRRPQGAVLVEDLVAYVLSIKGVMVSPAHSHLFSRSTGTIK